MLEIPAIDEMVVSAFLSRVGDTATHPGHIYDTVLRYSFVRVARRDCVADRTGTYVRRNIHMRGLYANGPG